MKISLAQFTTGRLFGPPGGINVMQFTIERGRTIAGPVGVGF
jgi:hypothetical protein